MTWVRVGNEGEEALVVRSAAGNGCLLRFADSVPIAASTTWMPGVAIIELREAFGYKEEDDGRDPAAGA